MTHRANRQEEADDVEHGAGDGRVAERVHKRFVVAVEAPLERLAEQVEHQDCHANCNHNNNNNDNSGFDDGACASITEFAIHGDINMH